MIDCQRTEFEEQKRAYSSLMLALQQSLADEREECNCNCSAVNALSSELKKGIVHQHTEFEAEMKALESQRQVLQHKFSEEQERCKLAHVASTAYHSGLPDASHSLFSQQLLSEDQE